MAHYVEIDSNKFEEFLSSQGFSRGIQGVEVVYFKPCKEDPRMVVKCYTSIKEGNDVARDCGKDAVRIVAVFVPVNGDKSYPLYKGSRVYRTTSQASVHQRTLFRIEEAFARCQEWREERLAKVRGVDPKLIAACEVAERGYGGRFVGGIIAGETGHAETTPAPATRPVASGASSRHVGSLGCQMRMTVRVVSRLHMPDHVLFTMSDKEGNILAYWSKKDLLQVNETYDIGFRVCGYNTFRDVKQTLVSDVVGKHVIL
jgi:hypothetical protein